MYTTSGVDAVATITELRSNTSELIEYVRESQKGVLIQKNNEPYAVLLDWEIYQEVMKDRLEAKDRPPKRHSRSKRSAEEQQPESSS